ncbi:Hypothetical predicted protein [Cloeon dipterum]|uniref:Uncharacterized protein n=1 Tax=Cloeon dipterum TaxID=197152 RepID=A0A8S1DAY3_9INSE|nr:Hypothetical predicted protein [Cloeon dipterum]
MESVGKLLLVLLSICLQIFTCSCSSLDFQHKNHSYWEIRIGANEKEFVYDFCQYDASNKKERCHNLPVETIDIRRKCNCTLNHTANAEKDSVYFTVNCINFTHDDLVGACPQKLTITYEQDKFVNLHEPVSIAEVQDGISIWKLLFFLSLVINVVCGVSLFMRRNYEPISGREE